MYILLLFIYLRIYELHSDLDIIFTLLLCYYIIFMLLIFVIYKLCYFNTKKC